MTGDFLSERLYAMLSDGRFHKYEKTIQKLMTSVPPSMALREREKSRARQLRSLEEMKRPRLTRPVQRSLEARIVYGQRAIAYQKLLAWIRSGTVEEVMSEGEKWIRLRRVPRSIVSLWMQEAGRVVLLEDEEVEELELDKDP